MINDFFQRVYLIGLNVSLLVDIKKILKDTYVLANGYFRKVSHQTISRYSIFWIWS